MSWNRHRYSINIISGNVYGRKQFFKQSQIVHTVCYRRFYNTVTLAWLKHIFKITTYITDLLVFYISLLTLEIFISSDQQNNWRLLKKLIYDHCLSFSSDIYSLLFFYFSFYFKFDFSFLPFWFALLWENMYIYIYIFI